MFLMCLEVILGVLNACLPVLKPVFSKIRESMVLNNCVHVWKPVFSKVGRSMKKFGGKRDINMSWKSRGISIFMRVSHLWQSFSGTRFGRESLDSIGSIEDPGRRISGGQSTSQAERVVGMRVFEIHVQRDIYVESEELELITRIV